MYIYQQTRKILEILNLADTQAKGMIARCMLLYCYRQILH